MKTLIATLLASALLILGGCNQSEPGGTPGKEFRLSAPATATNIKQGDTETVTISVKRDKDFKQNVKLDVAAPPPGITAELGSREVKASDKEDVPLRISVDKKAAVGTHTIKVTGTPEQGTANSVDVKVDVKEVGA